MDKEKRAANKVTDYRKYQLSGDLEQVVQGRVSDTIKLLEKSTMSLMLSEEVDLQEQLQAQLREQKENSAMLQQQVEAMKLQDAVEAEKLQQEQWQEAIKHLKQVRVEVAQEHEDNLQKIRSMGKEQQGCTRSQAAD